MKEKSGAWNFYRQRVKVKIEGFRIDRLINFAHEAGLPMRNICILSDTEAEGWIAAADLPALRSLAKSRYRITVLERQGPEHRMHQAIRRPATMAGVLIACAIVTVQSMVIANIKIQGYKAIPEDSLRLCLEQAGISEGVFRPSIDWETARESLRAEFPQLTWIQLVYDGRTVILNVEESDNDILSAEAGQQPVYSDIVADQSGYIEKISTLRGVAMAEAGDFVKAGDVLISGTVAMEPTTFQEDWPTEYYVRSRGEITALVPYRLNFNQERYTKTGEEKTQEEMMAVLNQQIRLWSKENLPENAEIVNESLNFSAKNNIIEIGMTLEVRQQIGIEKEIMVGQENSDN